MNKVFLIGNLTRDPELSETNSGIAVCRFGLAVNRQYASSDGERETDFFQVTAWRGTGENVARYCKKGHKVAVVGSIQMRNYEDREGVKRTAVDIVAQDDVYIVWQVKVLQNNKALASTTLKDGMYYELTYDGDKKRCYVDAYKKWENFCVNGAGERQ